MKILRKLLTAAVVLAMLAVGVLFSLQNESPVPLDLLVFTFEPRGVAVWVLAAFALGGVLGMAVSSLILVRTRASLSTCRRQLDRAREEVSKARVEPSA
jgi:uncharacterized membrane protein YciS (DUF1049 family)